MTWQKWRPGPPENKHVRQSARGGVLTELSVYVCVCECVCGARVLVLVVGTIPLAHCYKSAAAKAQNTNGKKKKLATIPERPFCTSAHGQITADAYDRVTSVEKNVYRNKDHLITIAEPRNTRQTRRAKRRRIRSAYDITTVHARTNTKGKRTEPRMRPPRDDSSFSGVGKRPCSAVAEREKKNFVNLPNCVQIT